MGKYLIVIFIFCVVIGGLLYYLPALLGRAPNPAADAASGVVRGQKVIASESLVFYSGDEGNTFNAAYVEYAGDPISIYDFTYAESGRFYAITNQGLAVSDDRGESWGLISDDADVLRSAQILDLEIDNAHDGTGYVSVRTKAAAHIFRTRDNFKTLESIFVSQENITATALEIYGSELYLGMSDGEIVVYNTENSTFRLYGNILAPVTALAVKNDGTLYAVTEARGVFVRRIGENGWERAGESSLKKISNSLSIADISSNAALANELLLATSAGIVRTKNFGKTWEVLPTVAPEASPVHSIAGEPSGVIFAGKGNVLYASADGGATWSMRSFADPTRTINAISIFENGARIFIGTAGERPKPPAPPGFSFFGPPKFVVPEN